MIRFEAALPDSTTDTVEALTSNFSAIQEIEPSCLNNTVRISSGPSSFTVGIELVIVRVIILLAM